MKIIGIFPCSYLTISDLARVILIIKKFLEIYTGHEIMIFVTCRRSICFGSALWKLYYIRFVIHCLMQNEKLSGGMVFAVSSIDGFDGFPCNHTGLIIFTVGK